MEYGYYDTYTTGTSNMTGLETILGGMLLVIYLVVMINTILSIIAMWKIYTKAGKPGWASIIPIYNIVVLFEIVGLQWWHVLIAIFVPFAFLVYLIVVNVKLAKVFGQGTGMILLLIFIPIIGQLVLAFGKSTYNGQVDYSMNQTNMNNNSTNVNNDDYYYNAELDHMTQGQINEMVRNNMQQGQNTINNQQFNNQVNTMNNSNLNQNNINTQSNTTLNNQGNTNQMNNTINEVNTMNNSNLNQNNINVQSNTTLNNQGNINQMNNPINQANTMNNNIQQPNINQPGTKTCPICGSTQALNAIECSVCGSKIM